MQNDAAVPLKIDGSHVGAREQEHEQKGKAPVQVGKLNGNFPRFPFCFQQ